jgi:hypothetical protein
MKHSSLNHIYRIEKTSQKDYEFFLTQGNFLKVVDTLEKFEENILDQDSPKARDFVLFKRQLYAMYEVQNRSVNEHELFSFQVERHNLRWLYNANGEYINQLRKVDQLDQMADYKSLGQDEVFKRRTMNPRRLKGLGAFASSLYLYTYAPYLTLYLGSTVPILGAVAAAFYGMFSFAENQIVNSIKIIKDGGAHHGHIHINIGESAFSSSDIIVDVRDIKSMVALGNDDLGEDNKDGNVLYIKRYFNKSTGKWVEAPRALTLPGDAYRDRNFIEWINSDKEGESDLTEAFNDLMIQQNHQAVTEGKLGGFDLLVARDQVTLLGDSDTVADAQIRSNDPIVDQTLNRLKEIYGEEYLKNITDRELFALYKQHSLSQ